MNNTGKRRSAVRIMAGLIGLMSPVMVFIVPAIILGVFGFWAATAIPVLGSVGVLTVLGGDTGYSVKTLSIWLISFGILRGILRYGEQACNHYIAFRVLALIRDRVFGALRKLCPAKLEVRGKGDLIALITSDVELLEVFYAHTLSPIAIAVSVSAVMTIFIWKMNMYAGLIALCAYITVGAVIPVINGRLVSGGGMEYRTASAKLNSLFLDSLRGLRELMQFGAADKRRDEINSLTDELAKIHNSLKKRETVSRSITDTVIYAFDVMMIGAVGYMSAKGAMTAADAVICAAALISSYGPVIALSNLSNSLAQTLASGERVLSLLEEGPETEEITDGVDISADSISCRDIGFSYSGEKILDDLSIDIAPGSITGILGRSGCGKSTLLKLMMRFWDINEGKIILSDIDGSVADIKDINTSCLRRCESYYTQETHLFNDTIANNIKIAKPGASIDEIKEAARLASIDSFIETLPDGYDTQTGELGDRLSGGERQRIGLARAFLSGADIMLLDEPTSNLDSLNEAVILKSLRKAKGKTIVLVSHRRSTLAAADMIYMLESKRSS